MQSRCKNLGFNREELDGSFSVQLGSSCSLSLPTLGRLSQFCWHMWWSGQQKAVTNVKDCLLLTIAMMAIKELSPRTGSGKFLWRNARAGRRQSDPCAYCSCFQQSATSGLVQAITLLFWVCFSAWWRCFVRGGPLTSARASHLPRIFSLWQSETGRLLV